VAQDNVANNFCKNKVVPFGIAEDQRLFFAIDTGKVLMIFSPKEAGGEGTL